MHDLMAASLFPAVRHTVDALLAEGDRIPDERKLALHTLADYIAGKRAKGGPVQLVFICTHNSRRSHISQIWAATAAAYFGLGDVRCYSGGTEATAFNPRAVAAMKRAGFQIESPGGSNPHYRVHFAPGAPAVECFSKVYDDPANPRSDFAAVMTCSEADANCPFIPGATRIALTYEDPKAADDTPDEAARYDERVRQIGRELLYTMQRAAR
jgi:arsenate reductase (thioredoxin)